MSVIIQSDISYELSRVARGDETLPLIQFKTLPRTQKHFPRIQKQIPESETTFPESKKTSQNPKHFVLGSVLDHGTCFWILARIFGLWKVFSWWGQKPPLKCLLRQNLRIFTFLFISWPILPDRLRLLTK